MRRAARIICLVAWTAALTSTTFTPWPWPARPPGAGDAFQVVFRIGGVAADVLAGYLLLATGTSAIAAMSRHQVACRMAVVVSPVALRRAVATAVSASTIWVASPVPVSADSGDTVITEVVVVADDGVAGLPVARDRDTPRPEAEQRTWTVRPGDHFWSIAERLSATEGGVADLWRSLVAANRDRLVHPGDPDLLVPGQTLRIPDTAHTSRRS